MDYTNEELERLKALHEDYVAGDKCLSVNELKDLLKYLHGTAQHQATAQSGVLAAVEFERSIKQVLKESMGQGLSVSQASGILSLVKTEVEMSFFLRTGGFNSSIQDIVLNTDVEGP